MSKIDIKQLKVELKAVGERTDNIRITQLKKAGLIEIVINGKEKEYTLTEKWFTQYTEKEVLSPEPVQKEAVEEILPPPPLEEEGKDLLSKSSLKALLKKFDKQYSDKSIKEYVQLERISVKGDSYIISSDFMEQMQKEKQEKLQNLLKIEAEKQKVKDLRSDKAEKTIELLEAKEELDDWLINFDETAKVLRLDSEQGNDWLFNGKCYDVVNNAIIYDMATAKVREIIGVTADLEYNKLERQLKRSIRFRSSQNVIKLEGIDKGRIPFAFKNGTLYITDEGTEFKENYWEPKDCLFFSFQFNFNYEMLNLNEQDSFFLHWAELQFESLTEFFYISLADLFLTRLDSQKCYYYYGSAGTGKSTLIEIIKEATTTSKVSHVEPEKVGDKFGPNACYSSIINLASEISERHISSKEFKKVTARDVNELEYKGKESYTTRPTAKWLCVAEKLPNITTEGGVQRRLIPIEISGKKISEWKGEFIPGSEVKPKLIGDKAGLFFAVFQGIKLLKKFNFDIEKAFSYMGGEGEKKKLILQNNPCAEFLEYATVKKEGSAIRMIELYMVYERAISEIPDFTGRKSLTSTTFANNVKDYVAKDDIVNLANAGSIAGKKILKGNYLVGYDFSDDMKAFIRKCEFKDPFCYGEFIIYEYLMAKK